MASKKDNNQKEFLNRKVFHDYEVSDVIEAGIELLGSEVKAIRAGRVNLRDSFIRIIKNEMFLLNMHVSYLDTAHVSYRPEEARARKILIHRKQINKFFQKVTRDGFTIVVTKLYFNDKNFIKLNIGIGQGKKLHDKRDALKEKDLKRESDRAKKEWSR
ncbi:MAG: SsrA-binding protein SmpB [Arcobacteraceae bacterium]|jgi:SsrA-binding protein